METFCVWPVLLFRPNPVPWSRFLRPYDHPNFSPFQLVALLLANASVAARLDDTFRRDGDTGSPFASEAGAHRWRRRRAAAIASAALWFALVLVGAALASH